MSVNWEKNHRFHNTNLQTTEMKLDKIMLATREKTGQMDVLFGLVFNERRNNSESRAVAIPLVREDKR